MTGMDESPETPAVSEAPVVSEGAPVAEQAGPPPGPPGVPAVPSTRVRRVSPVTVLAIVALSIGAAVGIVLALANRSAGPSTPLRAGWTRHTVRAAGFRIDLPPGWDAVSTTSVTSAYEQLKASNPALADLVRTQLGGGLSRLIKLLAFDTKSPTLVEDFATNANVVVAPVARGTTFSSFLQQTLDQLAAVPGTTDVRGQRGTLPAGSSARVRATVSLSSGATKVEYATVQYLLLHDGTGYVISFATLPDQVEFYLPLFEEIAKTLWFA